MRVQNWQVVGLLALSALAACERAEGGVESEKSSAVAQSPAPGTTAPVTVTEEKPGFFARAAIKPEQAQQAALAKVPGGTIAKGELEEEDGRLIYSFDIKVAGQEGITEVHVDAQTGAVLKTEHEDDDEDEENEAADAKEKR
ncbi:MAG: PepSY domain-containing protein [Longimicrobiales bacterium]